MFEKCPEIMSVYEVADELCVGKNRVYELLANGELKGIRIGHVWKIPKDSLVEFVNEQIAAQSEKIKNSKKCPITRIA